MNSSRRVLVRVTLTTGTRHDFNDTHCSAIDESIVEVLGKTVLDALYRTLSDTYGVTRNELPYRTDTLFQILENTFGVYGAKTLGTHIAQKFYVKLNLTFHTHDGYSLHDYLEDAKTKLAKES